MNRRILLLNLALVALAGVLVWQLRVRWLAARAHEREVLLQAARSRPVLEPPPFAPPPPAQPGDYVEVAQKTLFSKDRNPNVIPDAPPPPPPPKPMPPLPLYHGQMALGQPVVLLSLPGKDQKGYHEGEEVGPFTLVSFDRESITFEWEDKTVERKLADLAPKEAPPAPQAAAAAPAAPAPAPAAVRSLSGGSSAPEAPSAPALGTDMGGGFRACAPGDNSPAGTVLNGYRKVVARSLIGSSCHWEQVK